MIDLNSTMEEIIDEINSKGSGGGTTELTTQYVRITDLEDGIYKWVYDGTKTLYYSGETSTSSYSFSAGSQYLIVYGYRETGATPSVYYKRWLLIGEGNISGTSKGSQNIVYGITSATTGSYTNRTFDYIPTTPAMTLSGAQTVSGNKTFSGTNTHSGTETFTGAVEFTDATFSDSAQFLGNVDFTNATVTGLSVSGSSDLTELKRVMRLLHTEKYTQSIQATKFTSTLMGSIHKIEKPSNDLLEASEYVLYSVDFEDTSAYLNATITIGNNGLINDSGTFSFTVQGSSIATGQNINVICVFVPSAFL